MRCPQGNGGEHPAFGRAVKLGDDQAGQAQSLIKSFDLGQRILTGVAINHQQNFMRRSGICFLHHTLDFFQFFHQVQLGGQASGGIDQHHIAATRFASGHRVKADRRRVALVLADDVYLVAVCPHHQLLFGGGAKCVCCCQQHTGTCIMQMPGQLAYGSGFARAVDTGDHDDGRGVLADVQWAFEGLQQVGQYLHQQGLHLIGTLAPRLFHFFFEVVQDVLGGRHTGIGHQQRRFQFFIQLVIYEFAAEHPGDAAASALQTAAQASQPVSCGDFRSYCIARLSRCRGFSLENIEHGCRFLQCAMRATAHAL